MGLDADICPMTWKMRADSVIGFEGIVAKVRGFGRARLQTQFVPSNSKCISGIKWG
jgi:hypothetical protein